MTFNSLEFLVFYPIVAFLYFLLPHRLRMPLLLIASYYFYACYNPVLLLLIIGTTLVSWLFARAMERTDSLRLRRLYMTLTLVVCLGVLFFFKYFDFLYGSVKGIIELFGGEISSLELGLVLPVGISFYTFQTLSYVIDVYRGRIECERSFFYYALFVSFFPQLVAGPIERPENLLPQLKAEHKFAREDAVAGAKHVIVGFFKKIVVADLLSVYVEAVYSSPNEATGLGVVIATCFFAAQIYCDFSGYTDIAIGCARIMGIRLMQNFNHPYSSSSIKEFWSRWHISLSSWFKDYLYIPLGGSRCGRWRYYLNLMIVFLVSGLWHGAAWTFVLWGALHGIYQIVGHLTLPARQALLKRFNLTEKSIPVSCFRRIFTFILVAFSWIFFRAGSVSDAFTLIGRLFSGWGGGIGETLSLMGLSTVGIVTSAVSLLLLLLIDSAVVYGEERETGNELSSDLLVKNGSFLYFVWLILFAWLLLYSKDVVSTFIYFQF